MVMTLRIAPEVVAAEVPPEGMPQLVGAKALFGLGVCVFEVLALGLAFGSWGVYAALLIGVLTAVAVNGSMLLRFRAERAAGRNPVRSSGDEPRSADLLQAGDWICDKKTYDQKHAAAKRVFDERWRAWDAKAKRAQTRFDKETGSWERKNEGRSSDQLSGPRPERPKILDQEPTFTAPPKELRRVLALGKGGPRIEIALLGGRGRLTLMADHDQMFLSTSSGPRRSHPEPKVAAAVSSLLAALDQEERESKVRDLLLADGIPEPAFHHALRASLNLQLLTRAHTRTTDELVALFQGRPRDTARTLVRTRAGDIWSKADQSL
jgi:hypothetical protein